MAKKVIAPPDGDEDNGTKPKKKRHWCCTCCLTLFVVCLVLDVAILGVGWYFGDKYSKEYLNMSLGDVFGVVNGLYWTDDKDVVTNGFGADDLDGFYSEIKKNVLLKADADIDFDAALELAVEKFIGGDGTSDPATALRRNSDGDGDGANGDNDIMNILVDMVAEVFTRDNIDKDRLKAYSETHDEYFLELKDKQLAAFVQNVIDVVLKNADKLDMFKEYAEMVDFKEAVALKQISFKTLSQKNEQGEEIKVATTADVTVWLGLQDTAGKALTYYIDQQGYTWASPLARVLANLLLPKNLYVTLSVPLQGEADVQMTINDMNATKRDRLYAIVDGVMSLTGSGSQSVQEMLNGIGDQIKPYLDMLAETDGDMFETDGEIKLDLIGMMTKMASESISADDPLTKADFMFTLQAVLTSSAEKRRNELKPYLFEGWYERADGTLVYKPTDTAGLTPVDYGRKFVEEVEAKYSLDFGEDKSIDAVLASLGISFDGAASGPNVDDVLEKINKARFRASLDAELDSLDLRVTDRMLASALSSQLDSVLGDLGDMRITLDALTFVELENHPDHLYALVAVTADISSMLDSLGGDNKLMSLAANVLPEELMLTVTVDITQSLPANDEYTPVSFLLNDYQNTDRVLDTLTKLAPSLDLKSATGDIERTLRDLILQLDDTIGITLSPSAVLDDELMQSGAVVMPNLFKIVTDLALTDDNGEPVVTAVELQSVLRGLLDTDGFDAEGDIAADYSEFINDVVDMYYLNVDPAEIADFEQLADCISGGDGFGSSKFRIGTEDNLDPDKTYMIYDRRSADELCPVMSSRELGALIAEKFGSGDGAYAVHSVETGEDKLIITLAIDVGSLMPAEVGRLMDLDKLYAVATVDFANVITTENADGTVSHAYAVDFTLNNMRASQLESTMKLVNRFAGDGMDITSKADEIGSILYDQLQALNDGFGGEGFFKFTDAGLELKGFYNFLASNLDELKDCAADDIKAAIQGLYPRNDFSNPNNYDKDEFIVNPSPLASVEFPSGTMSDQQFNGYFKSVLVKGGFGTAANAEQTIALASGCNSAKAERVRGWINDRLAANEQISADGDYIVVTFSLSVNKSEDGEDGESDSVIDGFIPDEIFATVVLEKNGREFKNVGIIFNNMSSGAYGVILKIMGLESVEGEATSSEKVNINSIVDECVKSLNELGTLGEIMLLEHADTTDTCVGDVELPTLSIGG